MWQCERVEEDWEILNEGYGYRYMEDIDKMKKQADKVAVVNAME